MLSANRNSILSAPHHRKQRRRRRKTEKTQETDGASGACQELLAPEPTGMKQANQTTAAFDQHHPASWCTSPRFAAAIRH